MSRFPSYDPSMGVTQDQYSQQIAQANEQIYGGGLSSLSGGQHLTMLLDQFSDQEPKRPEGIEDQDWQKYIAARDEAAKYRKESGDMGQYVREGEGSYDQWKAMTANQDVSRPDLSILNPFMPGEPGFGRPNVMLPQPFLPRPDGVTPKPGLTPTDPNLVPRPDPSLNPFQPTMPEVQPPSPSVSPRPEPKPGIHFPQLPTGQKVSSFSDPENPGLNPPSIRLKHGGSLTDKVLRILRNLS